MGDLAYVVKALDESTWPAFAALVERNNGIFGGCWCLGFTLRTRLPTYPRNATRRSAPRRSVWSGRVRPTTRSSSRGGLRGLVPVRRPGRAALSTYEKLGFVRDRPIGKHSWVVRRVVKPSAA
jgi:hypothetical protein